MKTADAIAHFGTQHALAEALEVSQAAVAQWGDEVPPLRQLQLQALTLGKLKASSDVFKRKSASHAN
jgi:DNA-binding transcriptional regulator YdaS (Cro superfamily)